MTMSENEVVIPPITIQGEEIPSHARVAGPNKFVFRRQIRFGECDQAGIVYYPRYTDMFHEVTEDWWQWALHIEFNSMIRAGIGWPLVHLGTDFRRENRAGDFVDFEFSVKNIGTRSLETQILCFRDGDLSIEANLIQVMLDTRNHRALAIPQVIRDRFEAFREGKLAQCELGQPLIIERK